MAMSVNRYRSTASKYKGGAHEMYVTYEVKRSTRTGSTVMPKVKRIYIAGEVRHWQTGEVRKRSGRKVHGLAIEYQQDRSGYHRRDFTAQRGSTSYQVKPAHVGRTSQKFTQVVELPAAAEKVHFYTDAVKLPPRYRSALQNVR